MKKPIIIFLATGAYAGYSPYAPGTVGTLWGAALACLISGAGAHGQGLIIAGVIAASVFISGEAAKIIGRDDPSSIVCDEVAGFLVAVFLIPFTLFNAILVFLLFRFFDILKPYPAGYLDRKVKGGFGIVLDDVCAGVYANILARVVLWLLG